MLCTCMQIPVEVASFTGTLLIFADNKTCITGIGNLPCDTDVHRTIRVAVIVQQKSQKKFKKIAKKITKTRTLDPES